MSRPIVCHLHCLLTELNESSLTNCWPLTWNEKSRHKALRSVARLSNIVLYTFKYVCSCYKILEKFVGNKFTIINSFHLTEDRRSGDIWGIYSLRWSTLPLPHSILHCTLLFYLHFPSCSFSVIKLFAHRSSLDPFSGFSAIFFHWSTTIIGALTPQLPNASAMH